MRLTRKLAIFVVCLVILTLLYFATREEKKGFSTGNEVTAYLQTKYPELLTTSGGLAPRTVTIEKVGTDWYVAYVQNGSGRPILSARCFHVTNDASVSEQNYAVPPGDTSTKFSAKDCKTIQE